MGALIKQEITYANTCCKGRKDDAQQLVNQSGESLTSVEEHSMVPLRRP